MIKKLAFTSVLVVLALAMVVGGLILAGESVPTTDILIGDVSGVAGQTVSVDVAVNTQGQEILGASINLTFDGVVLPGAVAVPGPALPAGWTFIENLAGPGDHRIAIADPNALGNVLEGVLYTVSFTVATDAPLGTVPITAGLVNIPNGGVIKVVPGELSVVGQVISNAVITMGLAAMIDSLDVTPRTFKGPGGTTQQFTAIANLDDGTVVNVTNMAAWASTNQAVATVSATGVGTIMGPGNASITATINLIP